MSADYNSIAGELAMASAALVYLTDEPGRWAHFIKIMTDAPSPVPPPDPRLLTRERGRHAAAHLLGVAAGLVGGTVPDAADPDGRLS